MGKFHCPKAVFIIPESFSMFCFVILWKGWQSLLRLDGQGQSQTFLEEVTLQAMWSCPLLGRMLSCVCRRQRMDLQVLFPCFKYSHAKQYLKVRLEVYTFEKSFGQVLISLPALDQMILCDHICKLCSKIWTPCQRGTGPSELALPNPCTSLNSEHHVFRTFILIYWLHHKRDAERNKQGIENKMKKNELEFSWSDVQGWNGKFILPAKREKMWSHTWREAIECFQIQT